MIWSDRLAFRKLIPYHTIPYHTIPYHTIPYHISYHIIFISYHIISYHIISYHITSYLKLHSLHICHIASNYALSYHIIPSRLIIYHDALSLLSCCIVKMSHHIATSFHIIHWLKKSKWISWKRTILNCAQNDRVHHVQKKKKNTPPQKKKKKKTTKITARFMFVSITKLYR